MATNDRSRVEIGVTGTVQGWSNQGEDLRAAALRLVHSAEQGGNNSPARLYLEIKDEEAPLPGQSRLAATLVRTILRVEISDGDGLRDVNSAFGPAFVEAIDRELTQIRAAIELMHECPVVSHHGKGPCAFCVAFAMRDIIMLEGQPGEVICHCPDWWFPEQRRDEYRAMPHGPAIAHHEQCPKRWLKPEEAV